MPPKRVRIRVDMTAGQAQNFIAKLALDENSEEGREFRAYLVNNPSAVLWEYGIEASPELFPSTIELPTSDAMRNVQSIAPGEPVSVEGTPESLFPIFCMIFPHIALSDS